MSHDKRRRWDGMTNPNARAAKAEASLARRDSLIDQQIRAAQAAGQFDNLPGFGKPLPKDPSYDIAGEHWLGNHILKQSGFVPPWIELRKEISTERVEVKAALDAYRELARAVDSADPQSEAELTGLEDRYVSLATAINAKIDEHNGSCPPGQALTRFVEDATRRWK